MASTATITPSQIENIDIVPKSLSTNHENFFENADNSITPDNKSSNSSLNGNAKAVSDEDASSRSAADDDNTGFVEANGDFIIGIDEEDDSENAEELLFLQGEEEKMMQQDDFTDAVNNANTDACIAEILGPGDENSNLSSATPLLATEEPFQQVTTSQDTRTPVFTTAMVVTPQTSPVVTDAVRGETSQQAESLQDSSIVSSDQTQQQQTQTQSQLQENMEHQTAEINNNNNIIVEGELDCQASKRARDTETNDNDADSSSLFRVTKRVKIVETIDTDSYYVQRRRGISDVTENTEISLRRNRIDSIDLVSNAFDLEEMGINLSNNPEIVGSESNSQNLPPLENDNSQKNQAVEQLSLSGNYFRGRGYSLDFFALGMNEDEPIPATPATITSSNTNNHNSTELHQQQEVVTDQNIRNSVINDFDSKLRPRADSIVQNSMLSEFDSKLRPRGDSIIFDPSSFGDGGIHEANALDRMRRPSFALALDEMEIMNAPGFVEAHTPIPDSCGSQPAVSNTSAITEIKDCQHENLIRTQNKATSQMHFHELRSASNTGERIESCGTHTQAPQMIQVQTTLLRNNSADIILTPEAMCGSSGVLPIDQMELLNQGGRIGLYLPNARKERIAKFHSKRKMRIWRKRIKYDCRKKLADSRPRIKGRFVKRSDID